MFDTTVLETSPLNERRRIWQRYKAGKLDVEAATAQLLRLDIDERAAARYHRLKQTELRD